MFAATPFVPTPDSDAVTKLRQVLKSEQQAVYVAVVVEIGDEERDCYINVDNRIKKNGKGRMQLGWAVWQHSHLFVEGEPHAVYDPEDGSPWIDCTPHSIPDGSMFQKILFIPNEA